MRDFYEQHKDTIQVIAIIIVASIFFWIGWGFLDYIGWGV